MEYTCNFCAVGDLSVSEMQNDLTQDPPMLEIAAKHFWFTKAELISFHICDSCRKQLLDFHRFYCQVEKLHREVPDCKVEYVLFESNTNSFEHDSVNGKPDMEEANEEQIEIGTTESVEVDSEMRYIELEPIDIKAESEEKIEDESNDEKRKKFRREPMVTDDDIRIFCRLQCHICSEEFDYYNYLVNHCLKMHNQVCYVTCCNRRFDKLPMLQEHILVHIDPTIFQCKQCKKKLNSKRSLLRHHDSVHRSEDAMIYKCTMCPRKYAKQYLLNGHMAQHLDSRPSVTRPKCPICLKPMKNESWLDAHLLQKHGTTIDDIGLN